MIVMASMALGVFGHIGPRSDAPSYGKIQEKLQKMKREIRQLESQLGKAQRRHTRTKNRREKLEEEELSLRKELESKRKILEKDREDIERMLAVLAVNSMGESGNIENLLAKNITIKGLNRKRKEAIDRIKKIRYFKKNLNNLKERRLKFAETESELATFLAELKKKKRIKSQRYLKVSRKEIRSGNMKLDLPLQRYSKAIYSEKGVTMKFKATQKLHATGRGKIDFVGPLGKYGNVVMIDHGNDTRSVILGPLYPKVKKGQVVEEKEAIGSVGSGPDGGEVYFEVRRKNKIQHAAQFMKNTLLAKNHSGRIL